VITRGEHERGKDEVAQEVDDVVFLAEFVHAAARQPAEVDGEDEDRHEAEPEGRKGEARQGLPVVAKVVPDRSSAAAAPIMPTVMPRRIAIESAEPIRSMVAGRRLDDDPQNRPAAEERVAPVAGQHSGRPFEVLDVNRLVEPEDDLDPLDVLGSDGGVQGVDRERPRRAPNA